MLGLIGDFTAAMDLYNVTAEKYLRNNANRRTNCEIANIDKTARAAAAQIAAIKKLERSPEFEKLPKPLREMARLRVENPLDSLSELGEKAHPPIGKSGVDHRLRRLAEIAKEI